MSSFALSSSAMAAASGPAKARAAVKPAAAPVTASVRAGDAVLGKEKADTERCIECHGVEGHGGGAVGGDGRFAKLAGQHPDYILKQIRDFRSGARKYDQMGVMARSVSEEDVIDIAAYFASRTRMNGQGGERHEVGKALYEAGDPGRGIAACISCHGPQGKGLPATPLVPVIGGQDWRYLDQQLRDWRSGERRNSPDEAMNKLTRDLTDKEIESLASYLSGM